MKNISYLILLFLCLNFSHRLSAQAKFTVKRVQALQQNVEPGEKAWLAITLSMEEHWHIYWLNAGASGMATTFSCENKLKTKLHLPLPKIFGSGDNVSYGYEKEVTLFLAVDIPKDAKGNLEVKGLLNLLSCNGEGCLPGEAKIAGEGTRLCGVRMEIYF